MSTTRYDQLGEQLKDPFDALKTRDAVSESERQVVRAVAAMVALHERHRVNERGRCRVCWVRPLWWREQRECTVYVALRKYLPQPKE